MAETSCGTVPLCGFCGRPVRGSDLCFIGGSTPYHIACTYSPKPSTIGCICPVGAEATCRGWSCPRRGAPRQAGASDG